MPPLRNPTPEPPRLTSPPPSHPGDSFSPPPAAPTPSLIPHHRQENQRSRRRWQAVALPSRHSRRILMWTSGDRCRRWWRHVTRLTLGKTGTTCTSF
ncbi:hypothetical protein LguiA_011508 [Lonicera macranthoides]